MLKRFPLTPQATADALQAEVRALVSAALDQAEPRAALGSLCVHLRAAFEGRHLTRHPLQALLALLHRGRGEGATDGQLRRVVVATYTAAVEAAGIALPPALQAAVGARTLLHFPAIHPAPLRHHSRSGVHATDGRANPVPGPHQRNRLILLEGGEWVTTVTVTNSVVSVTRGDSDTDPEPPPGAPAVVLPLAA